MKQLFCLIIILSFLCEALFIHCISISSLQPLKLVRTPLNVYFTAFKSIFLSLCTYYLVKMSCLISFECCQSSCEEHGTSEHYKKFLSTVGFEPPTPHPLISSVSF